jgi:hypothetical protein
MMSQTIIKSDVNRMLYNSLGFNNSTIESWWSSENVNFNFNTPESVYQSGAAGRQLVYNLVSMYAQHDVDRTAFEQSVKAFFKGKK